MKKKIFAFGSTVLLSLLTFACINNDEVARLDDLQRTETQLKNLDSDPLIAELKVIINDFKVNTKVLKSQDNDSKDIKVVLKRYENAKEINIVKEKLNRKYGNFDKLVDLKIIEENKNLKVQDRGCSFWSSVKIGVLTTLQCPPPNTAFMTQAQHLQALKEWGWCIDDVFYSNCEL